MTITQNPCPAVATTTPTVLGLTINGTIDVTYTVDFGDGSSQETATEANPLIEKLFTHTFAPGTYTVTLQLTNVNSDITLVHDFEAIQPIISIVLACETDLAMGDFSVTMEFDQAILPNNVTCDFNFGDGSVSYNLGKAR